MALLGQVIYAILRAVLPWLFSGEERTTIEHSPGLDGLDREFLAGNRDLLPPFGALLAAAFLLSACGGCALGGAKTEIRVVMCEPGSTVEIATDEKIDVIVQDAKGEPVPAKKNCAGMVATPKSVYRRLREAFIKQQGNLDEGK